MKRRIYSSLSVIAITSVIATGCNPLNKMVKNAALVKYEINPNPITLVGDSVELTISGKFPAEYFHKKVQGEIKPILKYPATGEQQTLELKKFELIGEALEGNGQKIPYASGGSFSYTDKVAYTPQMETAIVEVVVGGSFKKKTKEFPAVKVADGTIITQLLVKGDEKVILGKDAFVRITPISYDADIHYLINSSVVRGTELKMEDIVSFSKVLDSLEQNRIVLKKTDISAWASPDGEISKNENLANERAETAAKSLKTIFKKKKVEIGLNDDFYGKLGKGEDWEGFKKLMNESSIKDKDLIVRILEMHSDLNRRETEIKNLSKTYLEIAKDILPSLRRSKITVSAEITGYSDDELKELSANAPEELNIEELLYSASLTADLNEKLRIFQAASRIFPTDWRGSNNTGAILFMQNKVNEAAAEFEKAANISADEKVVKNNLGVIARVNGDKDKAYQMYEAASGAGKEVNYNKGIVDIMNGDYSKAAGNLADSKSFNEALAKLLNGNFDGAMQTIDASAEATEAMGAYLKAIAGARKDDAGIVTNNLRSAISKDPKLKSKAQKDAEFIKFRENGDFGSLVN